jgi:GDPmannose 4,6-dehydratase
LVRHYRDAHGLAASNGILFNHESPYRNPVFVTGKVVKSAVEIYRGRREKLALGNLTTARDWGHAKDYVRAMHLINISETPGDWVISTGISHTVSQLCEYVFRSLDLNYEDYIVQHPDYVRTEESMPLCGDSGPLRDRLGWECDYTFETMLDDMIEYWKGEIG